MNLQTVAELFQGFLPHADPALYEENPVILAFEASDGSKTKFTLDLTQRPGKVSLGIQGKPHAVFVATESDLMEYFRGAKSFQVLLQGRRLRVKGNMGKAARLRQGFFPALTAENLAKYRRPKL